MTWTAARPTKPGKYWLSIGIDHREKFASDVCREPHHVYLLDIFEEGGGLWLDGVIELGYCLPASALFNSYIEPADPFAESVPSLPSLRRRVEALMRFVSQPMPEDGPEARDRMMLKLTCAWLLTEDDRYPQDSVTS